MIIASHLTKRFATEREIKTAVDDLSFEVHAGEVYGLLGPNGAGKTTTLRMVMGTFPPDHGEIRIDGMRTDTHPLQILGRLGMISTNDGVYPWLTVHEMLSYFADLYGLPADLAQDRIQDLAMVLEIRDMLRQRCSTLSTGQRQRVIFARGLIHDPAVVLLDEPTRGLDIVGSRIAFDYIQLLRDRGKAVLLSTHRLDEAERICDRFGLLHRGRMRHEGSLVDLQRTTGQLHLVDMFTALLEASEPDKQPEEMSP
jgi:sodium transport system ATP-binding protein